MTHSSPTWYDRSIESRRYESALSELVAEQKSRVMLVTLSKDVDLVRSEMAILTALEDHRRTFLESTLDLADSDTYGIDAVVRARLDGSHALRPGEYCAECGLYDPSEGDD